MILKTLKSYFSSSINNMASAVSTTMPRVQNAAGLRAAARRRRNLSAIKAAHAHSAPSKVQFSESVRRRAKLHSSPVKVVIKPVPGRQLLDEEKDAQIRKAHSQVRLPALLARPPPREVDDAAIAAVEPELEGTPAQYVRDVLQMVGPRYACRFAFVKNIC